MTSTKCAQCGAVNFATDERCRRCGVVSSAAAPAAPVPAASFQYAGEPKLRSLLRWVLWIGGVAWLIAFIWSRSLLFTSEALEQARRWQVDNAIALLKQGGFSREAFVLRNLANYRATDNWWNIYEGHENAYTSTNFPLEIVTRYPAFFTESVDDTERAAILLHEAHHLFNCKDNHHWDCVPPVIYHPGETVVRK